MNTLVPATVRDASPPLHVGSWKRMAGFVFGIATQALFALTVVELFSFLRHGPDSPGQNWLVTDTILALQFAVPHSVLLHPRFRSLFRRWFPGEMHGVFFCAWTCVSLRLMFRFWQSSRFVLWDLDGPSAALIGALFYASWGSLIYSISLTGAGFQTGWTQWRCWYRRQPLPRRNFEARGAYQFVRHPVYLSFLGLIWLTPTMSADHAVLTGIWTSYIFVGSILKDQRLLLYLGDSYAEYMARVPGFPLMVAGPPGRRARQAVPRCEPPDISGRTALGSQTAQTARQDVNCVVRDHRCGRPGATPA